MQPTVQMRDVWTIADLDALDVEDWFRYEILDGALVVSPSTGGDHELVSTMLRVALYPAGLPAAVVVGPMGVSVGQSYLIPDLVVVDRARLRGVRLLDPGEVRLAVEIVSPGSQTMDRVVKPARYAAAGIANYWRVETDPVSLTAYTLVDGTYAEVGSWSSGVARLSEPFPVEIDVDGLLAV